MSVPEESLALETVTSVDSPTAVAIFAGLVDWSVVAAIATASSDTEMAVAVATSVLDELITDV